MKKSSLTWNFIRTYFAIGAMISLLAMVQTEVQTQALIKLSTRYKWAVFIVFLGINAAVWTYLAVRRREPTRVVDWLNALRSRLFWHQLLGIALILVPVPAYLYARADFFGRGMEAFFRLFWLWWWLVPLQTLGWKLVVGGEWSRVFAAALLSDGMAVQLYTLSLAVSDYPFSMGWSEASRFYYGSLPFSRLLYGERIPLSVMHGSRYLLQSILYIIPGAPLWAARLWQTILWLGLTLGAAWAAVRRLGKIGAARLLLATAWLFLFFFQGAVYYHLQVCVIIILIGVSTQRPVHSLASIMLASFWAGMSRVNWFPVPAMQAISLYILEVPYGRARGFWNYLRLPIFWGIIGIAAALAGQAFYVVISGNSNLEAFASSFTSALLWYRWWPSPTNPIGIIPAVIIVSIPALALIVWRLRQGAPALHWIRVSCLAAMLLVLLTGGLVVSTKIGGGGDLHNTDAYIVLLATLALYASAGDIAPETSSRTAVRPVPLGPAMLAMVVPLGFALLRMGSPYVYDPARASADLATLNREVRTYAGSGEVLFMYERQLLTFKLVHDVPVVPEYEVVTLMEMAISGNEPYLNQFYADLARHRFAAIVAHPQNLGVETGDFIEENDAWNRLVAQPLLCQYKPAVTLAYSKVQVLIPRGRPCEDFPPTMHQP